MKRAKERDSSETAAIKINRRKVCLLIIAIGICVLLLITLLGAGSIAANLMRLIDHIDQPAPRHRRRAA